MPRVSPRSRRTTTTLLTCVVLAACQGSPSDTPSETTEPANTAAAAPRQPHFTGRLPLSVQPALNAVGETACTPARNRVCSSDGTQGWVPITDPGEVVLVEAATSLNDEHTSWTTVLRFDRATTRQLSRAATNAAAAGGVVLLVRDGRAVTAVLPLDLEARRATFTGLTKPEAWALVTDFRTGQ